MTESVRTTIAVQGAREHNLKDVSIEIPRDALVVVTGLSGSGKSSLAFDTIYAEGQRRYMESLSAYAKRFIAQVRKPDVDFMFGLSPVISIEQKTVTANPRSTVGTMTDVSNYLNLLFATMATAHCPACGGETETLTPIQLVEKLFSLPEGTKVDIRAPVFPVHGEDSRFLFTELRKKGYRRVVSAGKELDMADELDVPVTGLEVICDRITIRKGADRQILAAVKDALMAGENFVKLVPEKGKLDIGCPSDGYVASDLVHQQFMFNNPQFACRTCSGLGTYLQVHLGLLVPDPSKSVRQSCFSTFTFDDDGSMGRFVYSVSAQYGIDLDTPFQDLPDEHRRILLHGTRDRVKLVRPPGATRTDRKWLDQRDDAEVRFEGIQGGIERAYRSYRERGEAADAMDAWLKRVMVEQVCPACRGTRLRESRHLFRINGKTLYDVGAMNFDELLTFLKKVRLPKRGRNAAKQILGEITGRLELLLGIGLDYLNFNRRSSTLSGGESQRIRLSTQIGSGLMGMLYVLDEPTIGLHPKDSAKMIATLRRLRDLGNTVLVVEHDEDTIRAADHIVEMGPGPGVHGGEVVVQGTIEDVCASERSWTGLFLSGRKEIPTPATRRPATGRSLVVRGARENNLKDIDVEIPLGQFVCVTGASGSGKSTLVDDILYKRLTNLMSDPRQLYGEHDALEGAEHVHSVVNIDQTP
ncbi:MAG: excinuclease ABC subunit UvrA, partial [Actinomycetota bacterium]